MQDNQRTIFQNDNTQLVSPETFFTSTACTSSHPALSRTCHPLSTLGAHWNVEFGRVNIFVRRLVYSVRSRVRACIVAKGGHTRYCLGFAVQSVNIALGKPAYQSSVTAGGVPENAVDGNFNSDFGGGSCIHTEHGKAEQWWMVDLQGFYIITDVWIQNRISYDNLHDFVVDVFPQSPVENGEIDKRTCYSYSGVAPNENVHLACQTGTVGRFVRLLKLPDFITNPGLDILIICEVVVEATRINRPCGSVETIPGSADSSMTSSNQIVQSLTRVQCLHRCYYNYKCQGFNFKETDGSCQITTDPDQPIQPNAGWTYYPVN